MGGDRRRLRGRRGRRELRRPAAQAAAAAPRGLDGAPRLRAPLRPARRAVADGGGRGRGLPRRALAQPREHVLRDDAAAVRAGGGALARDVVRLAPGARASARRLRARRPRLRRRRPPRHARRRRGLCRRPVHDRDLDPEHQAPRAARRRAARSQLRRMSPLHGRTRAQ